MSANPHNALETMSVQLLVFLAFAALAAEVAASSRTRPTFPTRSQHNRRQKTAPPLRQRHHFVLHGPPPPLRQSFRPFHRNAFMAPPPPFQFMGPGHGGPARRPTRWRHNPAPINTRSNFGGRRRQHMTVQQRPRVNMPAMNNAADFRAPISNEMLQECIRQAGLQQFASFQHGPAEQKRPSYDPSPQVGCGRKRMFCEI